MIKLSNKSKHEDCLNFFLGAFILIITVVSIDFIIGNLLKTFYFKQQSGLEFRTTYSIEKTRADLLVFGSSTANHNYEPNTFKKRLNDSFYNVGRDGTSIFYDYAILLGILKRYVPKIIILNFDDQELGINQQSYDELSVLLPFYKNHPEIRSIVNLKSPYEKYKLLSHIYPYNSSIFTIAVGNMEFNKKRSEDIDGYVPLKKVWTKPVKNGGAYFNKKLDTNKIKMYNWFIKDCIEKNIKLYIICAPVFIKGNHQSNSISLGKKIANTYKINFFDFSGDSVFLNSPGLFADISHLNDKGARIFSSKVAQKILACETKKQYDGNMKCIIPQ